MCRAQPTGFIDICRVIFGNWPSWQVRQLVGIGLAGPDGRPVTQVTNNFSQTILTDSDVTFSSESLISTLNNWRNLTEWFLFSSIRTSKAMYIVCVAVLLTATHAPPTISENPFTHILHRSHSLWPTRCNSASTNDPSFDSVRVDPPTLKVPAPAAWHRALISPVDDTAYIHSPAGR